MNFLAPEDGPAAEWHEVARAAEEARASAVELVRRAEWEAGYSRAVRRRARIVRTAAADLRHERLRSGGASPQ